jgi:hypothetical protein
VTWVALLLADPSPCLRRLVLEGLLGQDGKEVQELEQLCETDPLLVDLLRIQQRNGSWRGKDVPSFPRASVQKATALALMRLGYVGLGREHPAVQRGATFLFSRQRKDGSWPLPGKQEAEEENEGYSMIPLQTAIPLRALASCGYGTDPRAERAYEWLLAQRLPDGAWPTGVASGTYGYVAGYRRLAHSRWGCRSNTTEALCAFAWHPTRRHSEEAKRALDLLLGRDTRERHALGFEVARLIGAEQTRGFMTRHARFDVALLLDLCWRVGASVEDDRVSRLVQFVRESQGAHGLWEYLSRPQATRWVTFDLLRSLSRLTGERAASSEWLAWEPRTPFRAYAHRTRRF